MRPWFVGVCIRALWGYASIQYGLMHPYFTGLCTRTARTYAPVFYSVTVSSFAQRLVFTALRGLPPPEAFVLPPPVPKGFIAMSRAGLFSAMTEEALTAASRKLHNTAADEKLIKSLELNSYGVRRADGHC